MATKSTTTVQWPKDVYMHDGQVTHVGPFATHPDLIAAGTPVDMTEAEIKAVEEALAPEPEEEELTPAQLAAIRKALAPKEDK